MTGYTRNDVTDNIANSKIANADDLDGEFNAIQAAFNSTSGHVHDGTTGNGAPITKVGPSQDLIVAASTVLPKTTNTLDLGSSSLQFKDIWIDGAANIDALIADTADINAGTVDGVVIGSSVPEAITGTTITATSFVGPLTGTASNATTAVTLTGLTSSITELNYVAGVTSAIQTQLDAKQALDAGLTSIAGLTTTADRMIYTTASDVYAVATLTAAGRALLDDADAATQLVTLGINATATEINKLSGVTASTTEINKLTGLTATTAELNKLAGTPAGLTSTELGYVDGVTSAIQTQLDSKQPLDSDLTAVAGLAANGIVTRTGTGTFEVRTITAGTNITITNGDGVSGNPTINATSPITVGTAVTASGQANIDFTGIPSTARRVSVMAAGLSSAGASILAVRMGTSGGFVTTGYESSAFNQGGNATSSTGFILERNAAAAADARSGIATFVKVSGNLWVESGTLTIGGDTCGSAGQVTLSGALTQIRVYTTTADTFDAGSVNIMWE